MQTKKCFIIAVLTVQLISMAKAEWEIITPNPRIVNLQSIDDTWYAFEYSGTGGSVFVRSNNFGQTWDTVPGFSGIFKLRIHKEKIMVFGIYNGIRKYYLSTNNAQTWEPLNWPLSASAGSIDMLMTDTSMFISASKNNEVESPVYRSLDEGKTWHPLDIDTENKHFETARDWEGLCEYNGNICTFVGKIGFFISDNGGNTWTKINTGFNITDEVLANIYDAPMHSSKYGLFINLNKKWYRFKGDSWEQLNYKAYYFEPNINDWKEFGESQYPSISVRDIRPPYMVATNSEAGLGNVLYSLDNGKTWYRFASYDYPTAWGSSVTLQGNYVYGGMNQGFARRSLSEAIQHKIKEPEKSSNTSASPEEVANLLSLLGAGSMDELLDALGIDSDELSNDELRDFLEDYIGNEFSSDLFSNSQPATCSFMGMPAWSVNIANLKLFMRDIIYRKKGIGPEVKLALNYNKTPDTLNGMFGHNWQFEYELTLKQYDTLVVLRTATGAKYLFTNGTAITNGATAYTLSCLHSKYTKLHWTGTNWRIEKGFAYEFLNFESAGSNTYRLQSVEDAYGKLLSLTYNAAGMPGTLTDASGRIYSFYYSGNRCDSLVAANDLIARFYYTNNRLTQSTDFDGVTTIYTYDASSNITKVDVAGRETTFSYTYDSDTLGMLASVTDPMGRSISYFSTPIDSASRLTNITYPGNKSISYQINHDRVVSITNPSGETKWVYYDSQGRPDSLVWYDESYSKMTYNNEGNIIQKRERNGRIYQYQYSSEHKMVFKGDENGDTLFSSSYNNHNQLISIKQRGGAIQLFGYNADGALAEVTTPEGQHYSIGRDSFGNITSLTNPLGNKLTVSYDDNGLFPVGQTDFNGHQYSFSYNNNGKLTQITMPDGSSRTFETDCCAQTGKIDENGNTVQVVRDASNRITQRTTAEGIVYPVSYDENGYITSFTTRLGAEKSVAYNNLGLLTSITDTEGSTKFNYSPGGQVTSITDKKGYKTNFTYTPQHQLSTITDALGHTSELHYLSNGLLQSFTNARNQSTELVYSPNGQVVEKRLNDTPYASFLYNKNGELISFTDSSGTTKYQLNELSFIDTITYPGNIKLGFKYDANGNISKIFYPNGLVVNYTIDNRNRISTIDWGSNSISFDYDAAGNLLSEHHSNGTTSEYIYNSDNALVHVKQFTFDTIFFSEDVSYTDGIITHNSMKISTKVSRIPYKMNNMSYNKIHQPEYNPFNNMFYTYDEDGNQKSFWYKTTRMMSAQYSHDNQITSLDSPDGKVQIKYDAMRYPRVIKTNKVYYDHKGRLLFETDQSGNLLHAYIYRGKRLMAVQTASNTSCFYHYSRHGHTVAMTDEQGHIANAYAYTAHGELIGKEETIENRFTFLGAFGAIRLSDSYILTGSRVYCTLMGRYIQRDPLGFFTGNNPYVYAANNPLAGIDPLGFDAADATINTLDFDPPSDNEYSTAGGTANPYADDLPYRSNDWDTYGSAVSNTLNDISNNPIFDFVPDPISLPVSTLKAIDKLAKKDIGGALWQFMPFNNSLEAVGNIIDEQLKYTDPSKSSGLGIFGQFNQQKTFSCEL